LWYRWDHLCGTVGTMIEKRDVCKCEECGAVWLPSGDPSKVMRCSKCKSRKWNTGHKPAATYKDQPPIAKLAADGTVKPASKTGGPSRYERPTHTNGCTCGLCQIRKHEPESQAQIKEPAATGKSRPKKGGCAI
jgi:Zn-finger nucleic acid-binding protein